MKTEQEWIAPLAEALNKGYAIGRPLGERTQALIRAIQLDARKQGYTEAAECLTHQQTHPEHQILELAQRNILFARDRLEQDTKQ